MRITKKTNFLGVTNVIVYFLKEDSRRGNHYYENCVILLLFIRTNTLQMYEYNIAILFALFQVVGISLSYTLTRLIREYEVAKDDK